MITGLANSRAARLTCSSRPSLRCKGLHRVQVYSPNRQDRPRFAQVHESASTAPGSLFMLRAVYVEQIDEMQEINVGHAGDQINPGFLQASEYLSRTFWDAHVYLQSNGDISRGV